jgi:hypothetical protein
MLAASEDAEISGLVNVAIDADRELDLCARNVDVADLGFSVAAMLPTVLAWLAWVSPSPMSAVRAHHSALGHSKLGHVRMDASPSPPPATDMRFPNRPPAEAPNAKYGHDPRDGSEDVSGDSNWANMLFERGAGKVNTLQTMEQFVGALHVAEKAGEIVVLKFKRVGCAACASTEKQYAEKAKRYSAKAKFLMTPISSLTDGAPFIPN